MQETQKLNRLKFDSAGSVYCAEQWHREIIARIETDLECEGCGRKGWVYEFDLSASLCSTCLRKMADFLDGVLY